MKLNQQHESTPDFSELVQFSDVAPPRSPPTRGLGLIVATTPGVVVEVAAIRWRARVVRGLAVERGDRVLFERVPSLDELVVTHVVDGAPQRPLPALEHLDVRVDQGKGLRVLDAEGAELGVLTVGMNGEPTLRLTGREGRIECEGRLVVSATSVDIEARAGDACLRARGDVRVDGETVRLNDPT